MYCSECLQDLDVTDTIIVSRDQMGRAIYYHTVGECPPTVQPKVAYRLRPFCRMAKDYHAPQHSACSVVQEPTSAAPYYMVCSCDCHAQGDHDNV